MNFFTVCLEDVCGTDRKIQLQGVDKLLGMCTLTLTFPSIFSSNADLGCLVQ